MAKLESLIVDLQVQNAQLKEGLDQANAKLDAFGKKVEGVGKVMEGLFGAEMAKKAYEFLSELVVHGTEAEAALLKMSQAAGVGVESLSRLTYAAQLTGVGNEELAVSLGKMNKNLAEAYAGSKKQEGAFQALGVSIKDSSGHLKNADEVLYEVADKFKGMEDGSAKSAIAMEMFGKSGARLIPLLNQGSDGLRAMGVEAQQLGLVISTEAAEGAEKFSQSLERLKKVGEGAELQLSTQLAPTITHVAEAMTDFFKNQDLATGFGKAFSFAMKVGASAATGFVGAIQSLSTQVNTLLEVMQEGATMNAERIPGVLKRNADALVKIVDDTQAAIAKIWSDDPLKGGEKEGGSKSSGTSSLRDGIKLKITMGELEFNPTQAAQNVADSVADSLNNWFEEAKRAYEAEIQDLPIMGPTAYGNEGPSAKQNTGRGFAQPRKAFGGATTASNGDGVFRSPAVSALETVAAGVGHVMKGFGGMLGEVGRTMLGKLGAVGQAVGGFIDKLMDGDIWGAIGTFLATIMTSVKGFEPLVQIASGILLSIAPIFNGILDALKPLLGAVGVFLNIIMTALGPALNGLGQAFLAIAPLMILIGKLVGSILTPIFRLLGTLFKGLAEVITMVLFPVLKYISLGVLYVMKGIAWVWNAIIDALAGILRWIGGFEIAGAKPFDFLNQWADTIEKAKATTGDLDQQITDLNNTTVDSATAQASDAAANYEAAGAADGTATAMNKVTAALTNIPSWFKVASERWHAAAADGGSAGFHGSSVGASPVKVFIGNDEIAARIEAWQQSRNWRKGRS